MKRSDKPKVMFRWLLLWRLLGVNGTQRVLLALIDYRYEADSSQYRVNVLQGRREWRLWPGRIDQLEVRAASGCREMDVGADEALIDGSISKDDSTFLPDCHR